MADDTSIKFLITDSYESAVETLHVLLDTAKRQFFTGLTATIAEDSPDGHTVKATPTMTGKVTAPDGTTSVLKFPQLEDIPIHYSGGGGVTATHPVKQSTGDEVMLVNASRNIDSWHQNGGNENTPIDRRMHALSDMIAFPGIRSDKRKLDKVSSVSHQVRADDGTHLADVHPQNGITHQSSKMVLAQVGDAASHLLTAQAHKVDVAKILLNCG